MTHKGANNVSATVPLESNLYGITVSPDGTKLNEDNNIIYVIDTEPTYDSWKCLSQIR